MRVVSDLLLEMLRSTGFTVHDGLVVVDNSGKTVEYSLPYLTFMSSIGDYHAPRLDARPGILSVYFTVTYVGGTAEQARGLGEKARQALVRKRVAGAGVTRSGLIHLEESQRVRRQDDAVRLEGTPLFYGVDNYAVPVTLNSEGVPA